MASDEWKAVPDIWRSSAEKYGNNVALVDPYHDPPTTMTYKQVIFPPIFSVTFCHIVLITIHDENVLEAFFAPYL